MSKNLPVGIFSNTVLGRTGSVQGSNYWYFEVLGQYKAVMVGTWCFWSVQGSIGCHSVALGQFTAVLVGSW